MEIRSEEGRNVHETTHAGCSLPLHTPATFAQIPNCVRVQTSQLQKGKEYPSAPRKIWVILTDNLPLDTKKILSTANQGTCKDLDVRASSRTPVIREIQQQNHGRPSMFPPNGKRHGTARPGSPRHVVSSSETGEIWEFLAGRGGNPSNLPNKTVASRSNRKCTAPIENSKETGK